jgi:hypothetical protein
MPLFTVSPTSFGIEDEIQTPAWERGTILPGVTRVHSELIELAADESRSHDGEYGSR